MSKVLLGIIIVLLIVLIKVILKSNNSRNQPFASNNSDDAFEQMINEISYYAVKVVEHPDARSLYDALNTWDENKLYLLFTALRRDNYPQVSGEITYMAMFATMGAVSSRDKAPDNRFIYQMYIASIKMLLDTYTIRESKGTISLGVLNGMLRDYLCNVMGRKDIEIWDKLCDSAYDEENYNKPIWALIDQNLRKYDLMVADSMEEKEQSGSLRIVEKDDVKTKNKTKGQPVTQMKSKKKTKKK